ncbi:hypothetical protein [Crenothrix polyspora]|nr:hypothetical protein [Crenothrix polyspora]
MNQNTINDNVQERLRDLEAEKEITAAFLFALISTHPNLVSLKKSFLAASETLIATGNTKAVPDSWIRQQVDYQQLLCQWIDHNIDKAN